MNCKSGNEKKKTTWAWILYGETKHDKKIGYDLDFPSFTSYHIYFVHRGFGMTMYYVIVNDKHVMIEYNCVLFDLK